MSSTATETQTIIVLSTPGCYRCKVVKQHLEKNGINPVVIDVTEDAEWASWMAENGLRQVPQTISGDERVEGVDFDAINRLF